MKFAIFVTWVCLIHYSSVSGGIENGFFCQPVEDSCSTPPAPVSQGRPGKMGAKGIKGEHGNVGAKGDRGSQGVVDYGKVNTMIEAVVGDLTAKISSLESAVRTMKETISDAAYKWCKYRYAGKCYLALVHAKYDISLQAGLDFCNQWGMEPAEITGPDNLQKLLRYVATEMPSGRSRGIDIFIGMSYNPVNRELKFNNGSRANFVKWYPGYPKSDRNRMAMGIVVYRNPHSKEGMFNVNSNDGNLMGILCQK